MRVELDTSPALSPALFFFFSHVSNSVDTQCALINKHAGLGK